MDAKMGLDTLWVVLAAALVFFMNAGFALLEAGLCRSKNVANILGKNVLVFCLAVLAYWAVGYATMFAGFESLFVGPSATSPATVPVYAFFLFQACFVATACSIISGAVAERVKYEAFLLLAFLIALIPYPIVGRWAWGGGFLSEWGFHDFAGSSVVHAFGGFAALAGVLALGPRRGRYRKKGPVAFPGHSMPLATLGAFILWLGWFGFNAGSVLGVDDSVPRIAMVTILASSAGGVATTLLARFILGKPDLTMSLNGVLGGLVAITAPCAVVQPIGAVAIGLTAGSFVFLCVPFFDRLRVDDPVGALSVHLVNGVFGTVAVGLFAAPALRLGADGAQASYGLLYGGELSLLGVQLAGALIIGGFAFATSGALWLLLKKTMGIRVTEEEEYQGLDLSEMGMAAYGGAGGLGGTLDPSEMDPGHAAVAGLRPAAPE